MVHKGNEEGGNEACQWEQNRPHDEAGEWQLDEGPVPVHAAVGRRKHPEQSEENDEIIWSYNTPDETGGLRSSRIF